METKQKKQMDLLTAIEQIVEKAKDSKLSPEFYRKASRYIKYVSDKLNLTKEQSVMLALFVDNSDDDGFRLKDLSNFLKCSTTRFLRCSNEIDDLEKRGYINSGLDYRDKKKYDVPLEVIEAIKKNEAYKPKDVHNLSCRQLFCELDKIFEKRRHDYLTYEITVERIKRLLSCNQQLSFTNEVMNYALEDDDMILLIYFAHCFVNKHDNDIGNYDLEQLYRGDKKDLLSQINSDLVYGEHELQDYGIIEFSNVNGMIDRDLYHIKEDKKRELFSEIEIIDRRRRENEIHFDQIIAKELYYNEMNQHQVTELSQLLDDTNYQSIHSRLKSSGLRCGFTCLFYGAPGTGKTETVYQLARLTGRDILQVNVTQIRSCWVGESEKNIRSIFTSYRNRVSKVTKAPILLFNEADAIINQRQEGAERSVDKMENSIQNIILQEMENLDGIMIATTNLAQNMDKAFERRFLYKIKFEKPTLEARMHIWHEMIPTLSEDDTMTLAEKYEFSGGQIENIARHNAINGILYGDKGNSLETLMFYCDNERLETKQTRKIGF